MVASETHFLTADEASSIGSARSRTLNYQTARKFTEAYNYCPAFFSGVYDTGYISRPAP
jgi:hypothetical protein